MVHAIALGVMLSTWVRVSVASGALWALVLKTYTSVCALARRRRDRAENVEVTWLDVVLTRRMCRVTMCMRLVVGVLRTWSTASGGIGVVVGVQYVRYVCCSC